LTLGDIFFLKDFLAHHLRIKRHWFSLREVSHQDHHSFLTWSILAPLRRHCEHFFDQKSQIYEELCQIFESSLLKLSINSFEIYERQNSVFLRYPRVPSQRSLYCVSLTKEPVLPGNPTALPAMRSPCCVSMANEPVLAGNPSVLPAMRSPHCVSMANEPVLPSVSPAMRSPHWTNVPVLPGKWLPM